MAYTGAPAPRSSDFAGGTLPLLAYLAIAVVLMVAAASFVYIALADLVPDLHRQSRARYNESGLQVTLMLIGIAVVALLTGGAHPD